MRVYKKRRCVVKASCKSRVQIVVIDPCREMKKKRDRLSRLIRFAELRYRHNEIIQNPLSMTRLQENANNAGWPHLKIWESCRQVVPAHLYLRKVKKSDCQGLQIFIRARIFSWWIGVYEITAEFSFPLRAEQIGGAKAFWRLLNLFVGLRPQYPPPKSPSSLAHPLDGPADRVSTRTLPSTH